jgi:NAD(P)-dependent dehydrogenase (short-subunit alcohol dehydrogenase family)
MSNNKMSANNNKVAIVTGSATGLGYEIAVNPARNGFRTYATMRNLQKAKEINEITKNENLPLSVIQLDVTDNVSITKTEQRSAVAQLSILALSQGASVCHSSQRVFDAKQELAQDDICVTKDI